MNLNEHHFTDLLSTTCNIGSHGYNLPECSTEKVQTLCSTRLRAAEYGIGTP